MLFYQVLKHYGNHMNEREINRYWKKIVNTMAEGLMMVGPDGTIVM